MGMPVKLADELVVAAKAEAKAASRTITSQIEHWAIIGRAAELVMAHPELLGLKSFHGAFPSTPKRDEIHQLLRRIVDKPHDRKEALALIHASGAPVYETDPEHPGQIVQVSNDGTRRLGRLKGRRFVPEETIHRR